MAGWHHWLDGRESQWTLGVGDGQGSLVCCDSWGRKESDTTERLTWSDLIWFICLSTLGLSCGMWDLDPQLGPGSFLAFGSWSLSHWPTSRVSHHYFLSVWQQKLVDIDQENPDFKSEDLITGGFWRCQVGINVFRIGRFLRILIRAENVVDHLQKWQQFFSFCIHVPPSISLPLKFELVLWLAYQWVTSESGLMRTYISTQSLESLPSHERTRPS